MKPTITEVQHAIRVFEVVQGKEERVALYALNGLLAKLKREERQAQRKQDEKHRPLSIRICDFLFTHPGSTIPNVADTLEVSHERAKKEFEELFQNGAIGRHANGQSEEEWKTLPEDRKWIWHCAAGIEGMRAR